MKHPYRDLARKLRKNMTDAELFLWQRIRRRQLGGHQFNRQFPLGNYIVDFVCRDNRLIIELDGSQHADRVEQDAERTNWLEAIGYRVLRFWNHEVLTDWETIETVIYDALGEPELPPSEENPITNAENLSRLSEAQKQELERRLADHEANSDDVVPSEQIRADAHTRFNR